VKPPPFEYVRATSVSHALAELHADPEAKPLAGGQSLVALLNLRLARPSRLIDIGGLGELERTFDDADSIVLGGLVRHRWLELDPLVRTRVPLLSEAVRHIGHVAIRNRGTIGGSLAHADPAAELPVIMLALGATFYTDSLSRGRREIAAEDFFVSHFTTALHSDELLTWIRVPATRVREGWGFVEFSRRHGDFALAGAACTVRLDATGRVADARAAVMASGPRPMLVSDHTVVGESPDDGMPARLAADWTPAQVDGYRRHLTTVALRRALVTALRRAAAGPEEEAVR
jgi:carbon-monoxide dehydrogenase medium subunit